VKLLPYPEYKDSGVLWLGKIPKHWESYRLKYLAKINPTVDRKAEKPRTASFVPMATIRENYPWFTAEERHYFELEKGFTNFCDGDVLIAKITPCFENGKGGICRNLKNGIGFGSTEFHVVRPGSKLLTTYIYYLTITRNFRYFGKKHMQGSAGQQRVPTELIKNIQIGVPPYNEQTQIARFLDWKTAQINKFIRNKRRLIELLKEQKQNVINQAVTRGLDPKVKFKPSGVEWIGDIPEHWEARRLKTIAKVVLGKMLKTSPSKDDQLKPYLRSANIQWFEANLSDVASMWFSQSEMEQYRISKNDILVSEGGEVGRACIWQDELEECYIQNSVHKVTAGAEVLPLFLLYQFSAFGSKGAFKAVVNRVSIAHLTREKLVAVFFCKPPIEEQKTILAHIQAKTAEIDQAIIRAQREIELMREYRTRLISDVVTGQVDVRNMKCEGGSLNEDEFEDIEEVEEEIELPEGGEDDE